MYYFDDGDRIVDSVSLDFDFDGINFDPIFEGDCKVTGVIDLEANTQSVYGLQLWIQEHDNTDNDSSKWSESKPLNVLWDDIAFEINICESGKELDFDVDNSLAFEFDYCIDGNCFSTFKQDWFDNEELIVQEARHCTWTDMPISIDYDTMEPSIVNTATWSPTNNSTTYNADPTLITFEIGNWVSPTGTILVEPQHTIINGTGTNSTHFITINNVNANSTFAFGSTLNFINVNSYGENIGNQISQAVTTTQVCD
ncbi:MAG: hypothetical protein J4F36_14280 [Nitrosopumilaceae archaeon]|nr:hypothetical protein [Nitrosopumilaceae archaeon]